MRYALALLQKNSKPSNLFKMASSNTNTNTGATGQSKGIVQDTIDAVSNAAENAKETVESYMSGTQKEGNNASNSMNKTARNASNELGKAADDVKTSAQNTYDDMKTSAQNAKK